MTYEPELSFKISLFTSVDDAMVKVWDGAAWIDCPIKVWSGTEWESVNYEVTS